MLKPEMQHGANIYKYAKKLLLPSDTNYFLVRCTFAKKLFKYLLRQKIFVHTAESFDYLNPSYLRFTVKDKTSHQQLEKALHAFTQC